MPVQRTIESVFSYASACVATWVPREFLAPAPRGIKQSSRSPQTTLAVLDTHPD